MVRWATVSALFDSLDPLPPLLPRQKLQISFTLIIAHSRRCEDDLPLPCPALPSFHCLSVCTFFELLCAIAMYISIYEQQSVPVYMDNVHNAKGGGGGVRLALLRRRCCR